MCAIPAPWCPSLSNGACIAPQVKQAVLLSATEAAEMVLRVDDIIKCAVACWRCCNSLLPQLEHLPISHNLAHLPRGLQRSCTMWQLHCVVMTDTC